MTFEKKEGQGSLFYNEQPTDRHPIYKGYVVWKGEEIPLALWPGKEGSKVAFTVKAEAKQPQAQASTAKSSFTPRHNPNITSGLQKQSIMPDYDKAPLKLGQYKDDMDDEIPF